MKKKILKKSSLLPISLLLLGISLILACIDLGPDYPNSFFAPEVIHNDTLTNFFLSGDPLYKDVYKLDYKKGF